MYYEQLIRARSARARKRGGDSFKKLQRNAVRSTQRRRGGVCLQRRSIFDVLRLDGARNPRFFARRTFVDSRFRNPLASRRRFLRGRAVPRLPLPPPHPDKTVSALGTENRDSSRLSCNAGRSVGVWTEEGKRRENCVRKRKLLIPKGTTEYKRVEYLRINLNFILNLVRGRRTISLSLSLIKFVECNFHITV